MEYRKLAEQRSSDMEIRRRRLDDLDNTLLAKIAQKRQILNGLEEKISQTNLAFIKEITLQTS